MGMWRHQRSAPADTRGPLPPHGVPPARRRLRWLERLFLVIGFVSLGYYAYVSMETWLYQEWENRELEAILESGPPAAPAPAPRSDGTPAPSVPPAPQRGMVGRIEIPRLEVSAMIRTGIDTRTLQLAVGHIPGTALPGQRGNIGLAGHRDTFFRQLRNIRPDDEIRVVTPAGTFMYRVQFTTIVQPRDTWVLNRTSAPAITLVTCYPFTYVGTAPKRFIVRATAVDAPGHATLHDTRPTAATRRHRRAFAPRTIPLY